MMDADKLRAAVEFFKGYRYENEHHVVALREAAETLLAIMDALNKDGTTFPDLRLIVMGKNPTNREGG